MSDPVSNSEIEDVLASIRRLVSENAKALKGDRARDPEAEKLVLTPALRIDESESPSAKADVFAVDTDTWNDVPGKPEATENKGVFSHKEQRPLAVINDVSEADEALAEAAANAPEGVDPAAAETSGTDAAETGESQATADVSDEPGAGRLTVVTTDSDTQTDAEAESAPAESPAANDLEQRIAELETAMDLRPAGEEAGVATETDDVADTVTDTVTDAVTEAAEDEGGQGEEGTAPAGLDPLELTETTGAAETAAAQPVAETAEEPAPETSDAPPRSWIEGLVAAAAAAEATRLATRAKTRADEDESRSAEAATAEDAVDADMAEDADDAATTAQAGADADEAGSDESAAESADDAADMGTFELTEAHAAPPEPEALDLDAADTATLELAPELVSEEAEPETAEPEAAESEAEAVDAQTLADLPETGDLPETEGGPDAGEASADEGIEAGISDTPETTDAETAEPELVPDDASADDASAEELGTEAEAGPERSWVDRLIVAAATLRTAPKSAEPEDEEATGDAGENVEAPTVEAELEMAVGEAEAEEMLAAAPEDASETEAEATVDSDTPLALEPLNLVDPIAMGAEPEAVVPEWEPVEPPEQAEPEAAEPIVDIDTVLTGPWTAAAVDETGTDAPDDGTDPALDEITDAQTPATPEQATAEDAAVAADEVPVGALEWEPVDLLEQPETGADTASDTASPGPAALGALAAALGKATHDAAEPDAEATVADGDVGEDDEVAFDSDFASEDVDFHDEVGEITEGDEETPAPDLDEIADADEIDADSAAVAAAAEAEADWEDAGMASAGIALAASGLGSQDPADEIAAPDAVDAVALDEASLEDEAVIDEAMLRELVAQLVRDELQGVVGERITHNVRRLIRREIARALTLQDFDK